MRRCRLPAFVTLLALLQAPLHAAQQPAAQQPAARTAQRWGNRAGTWQIDLPAGWRQLAPGEALRLREMPSAPRELTLAQPNAFYAVGPVDQWLAGDFRGAWLYVVEGSDEWYVSEGFAAELAAMWKKREEATGERHELADVRRATIGEQQVEVVTAIRVATMPDARPAVKSLDVHAPAVGKQVFLSFSCAPAEFAANEAAFRTWAQSLTFARVRKGQQSLVDRLWTPVLVGLVVGAILLVLYRYTRARR
jgi:hypothetical protein